VSWGEYWKNPLGDIRVKFLCANPLQALWIVEIQIPRNVDLSQRGFLATPAPRNADAARERTRILKKFPA
jgi:hypothetical protein